MRPSRPFKYTERQNFGSFKMSDFKNFFRKSNKAYAPGVEDGPELIIVSVIIYSFLFVYFLILCRVMVPGLVKAPFVFPSVVGRKWC